MNDSSKTPVSTFDRINLPPEPEASQVMDVARGRRAGNVSRNEWIVKSFKEQIARFAEAVPTKVAGQAENA